MKFFNRSLIFISLLAMVGCGQIIIKERQSEAANAVGLDTAIAEPTGAEASKTLNPYLQNRPTVPGKAAALFDKANSAMAAGNWLQAEPLLQQLISAYPKFSGPYLNLGIVYLKLERPLDEVAQQFAQAIQVNPNNLQAYNYLASLKRQQGLFQEAEKLYLQALAVWPEHPQSHINLGILYDLYLQDWDSARQHYLRYQALRTEPDPQVAGWLVDIERRMQIAQTGGTGS